MWRFWDTTVWSPTVSARTFGAPSKADLTYNLRDQPGSHLGKTIAQCTGAQKSHHEVHSSLCLIAPPLHSGGSTPLHAESAPSEGCLGPIPASSKQDCSSLMSTVWHPASSSFITLSFCSDNKASSISLRFLPFPGSPFWC